MAETQYNSFSVNAQHMGHILSHEDLFAFMENSKQINSHSHTCNRFCKPVTEDDIIKISLAKRNLPKHKLNVPRQQPIYVPLTLMVV